MTLVLQTDQIQKREAFPLGDEVELVGRQLEISRISLAIILYREFRLSSLRKILKEFRFFLRI